MKKDKFLQCYLIIIFSFLVIIAPLFEKEHYIFIQFIDQLIILLSFIILLSLYRAIDVKLFYSELILPSIFLLSLVSSLFGEIKYQAFLITFDLFIYTFFLILIKQISKLMGEKIIIYIFIISAFILSLLCISRKIFPKNEFLMNLGLANPHNEALLILIGIIFSLEIINREKYFVAANILITFFLFSSVSAEILLSSRSILVIAGAIFFFLLFLSRRRIFRVFSIILIIFSIIAIIYKSHKIPFSWERIDIWKASIKMFGEHFWMGVSPGHYIFYAPQYNFPTYEYPARYLKFPNHAHNQWLHFICENGILTMLIIIPFIIYIFFSFYKLKLKNLLNLYSFFSLLSFIIFGFFNYFFDSYIASFGFIFSLAIFEGRKGDGFLLVQVNNKNKIRGLQFFIIIILIFFVFVPYFAHYYYDKATEFYKKNNIKEARKMINKSISLISINSIYLRQRAAINSVEFMEKKDLNLLPSIIRDYRLAKFTNSLDYNAYIEEAEFYLYLSQEMRTSEFLFNAIADYKSAMVINPYNPFIHFSLAQIYFSLKEFKKAIDELEIAVSIEPNFIESYYRLAQIYEIMNDKEKAKKSLSKAIELANKYRYYPRGSDEYLNKLLKIPPELLYQANPLE